MERRRRTTSSPLHCGGEGLGVGLPLGHILAVVVIRVVGLPDLPVAARAERRGGEAALVEQVGADAARRPGLACDPDLPVPSPAMSRRLTSSARRYPPPGPAITTVSPAAARV